MVDENNKSKKPVEIGDKVSVFYKGTFEDGTEFDSNFDGEPLKFTVGGGEMIKGFDDAVKGMKVDETKNIKLTPEEGYGNPKKELVVEVPISQFGGQEVKEGMGVTTENGQPGLITKVENEKATIDFNSPLAGKNLLFEIKLAEIESKKE